ncbi:hypothetical protein EUX98_g7248 [Antrodiella citrinella]|uniref:Uncharacterized protein n=1 Tax=Antrodiella citrinella TaxID=2447956 RepID=A0A4S4MMA4_9APHY|nr:hypothetical protein EUX98_g7248 [Antrodiella citrinella]
MGPQKLYVVNGDPNVESPDSATPTGRSVAPFLRPGGSYYGAMGTPRSVTASPAPTFSTQSTAMTSRTPMVPAATWDNRVGLRRSSRPEALPLPNPFMDPVSRPGTADTAYTALSFGSNSSSFGPRGNGLVKLTAGYNSSTSSFGPCGDAYMSGPDTVYLSPFQLSPEDDGGKTPRAPSSPGTESIYSLYDSPTDDEKELDLDVDLEKAMPVPATRAFNAPMVRQTLSSPPRMHTATPHSVHSVAPSVDWTSAEQRSQSPAQIQQQQVNRMPPPPSPVHARAASDPVYRPYTASPRLLHPQHAYPQQQPDSRDTTVLLPNPFPMVGATHTVRRYASIGHTRAQTSYYGVRNNVHLQAAMGRAPPRTQTYPVNVPGGKKSVSRAEWRQLVMNAASGR